jgi:transposase-like protein
MMENGKPRKRRQLTPEEKWEVFLEVTSQELSQADAARKWGVDVSVIVRLRAWRRTPRWRRSPRRSPGDQRRWRLSSWSCCARTTTGCPKR